MALPPTIPTSFVPHPSAAGNPHRFKTDYTGAFGFFAYGVLGVVFLLAIGVFAYGRILESSRDAKDAEVAAEIEKIKPADAEPFLRLKNRLSYSKTLLEAHPTLSGFLSLMGTVLPATVRLTSLNVSFGEDGPEVDGGGIAKSFNALAAASTALSSDGRIKDVIFSNIKIDPKDSSVSFVIHASLDPKLVAFSL